VTNGRLPEVLEGDNNKVYIGLLTPHSSIAETAKTMEMRKPYSINITSNTSHCKQSTIYAAHINCRYHKP